ncbi:MAG: anaerobic ribonucleoside-triphosphate reductase [Lachnospiraceae bacterium]|nr:anaerobic ribonucleoside-triphosphate reductase [Lachnospiraceae bacterium]
MNIIKRSGKEVEFDGTKIINAVEKANKEVPEADRLTETQVLQLERNVEAKCAQMGRAMGVEEIQDLVENEIMEARKFEAARKYITYRYTRKVLRNANTTDKQILSLIERDNEVVKQENSNKNPIENSVQRDYMAGEVSRDITKRLLLPDFIVKADEEGIIHFHDSDYFAQHMHNCCLVNLEDMLMNGTVISKTMIESPKSFATACNIATQCIAQIASSQYGGQSITLSHLVPFVNVSRMKLREAVKEEFDSEGIEVTEEKINSIAEKRLLREIRDGMQTIQYQVETLMTTNGQAPFITVFMWINEVEEPLRHDLSLLIEAMLEERITGVKNAKGVYITPAFPKLIYCLDENNTYPGSEYFYLTELAAKCTAKRMVPDYISAKVMRSLKQGDIYPCMGCRSFLTPDPKNHKYYGRFNQGVVTINLVDAACSSGGDEEKFWEILEDRLENICYPALMARHNRLMGTPSDVAPILWQHGALARLAPGETIDKLLYDNYSTISLGYAGICEMTKYMKGCSHTEEPGTDFALKVMQYLNDKCAGWRRKTNISFSIYGTPLESTTYKFAKCLQKRFGIIRGVTDKNYITNSYHVHVTEEIDAFSKLKFESRFQELSPGGAISYVEVPNMQNNIEAVLSVMQFIYENIMYAELNTKSDYCQECGYEGEISIVEYKGKLIWKCPNCGNTDQNLMNVARRTCGYIGTNFWNQGRTQEIAERVMHL